MESVFLPNEPDLLLVVPLESSDLIAKMWKQLKCPTRDEWIKRMWHIHTMGNYSALSKQELLQGAMNPEDIKLSEIGQFQNDKY